MRSVPGRFLPVWLILWHPNSVMADSLEVLSHTKGARRHYPLATWIQPIERAIHYISASVSILEVTTLC